MNTEKKFRSPVYFKLLLVMPVIAVVTLVFYSCGKTKNSESALTEVAPPPPPLPKDPTMLGNDTTWVYVDEMPEFPGGDNALLAYLAENTTYPELAKKNNIQGKVILRFCVTTKGTVTEVSVLKSVSPELDAEAVRVVKTLPLFTPAKNHGKIVSVWYMVPISFVLK